MYREAVVSGYFYPDNAIQLKKFFNQYISSSKDNAKIVIAPHAGYIYSGETAFKTLSSVNIPETVILLGPNHTGFGRKVSIYPEGEWETPFGDIIIDEDLIKTVISNGLTTDNMAHIKEHSLEVFMPMLKFLNNSVKVVPITLMHLSFSECQIVAEKLYNTIYKNIEKILLLVSTDFNHFENEDITQKKDMIAINEILMLDPEGLYNVVKDYNISMCGVIPCTIALLLAKKLNLTKAVLVEHTTSGKKSGDYSSVVGYAGIKIY
ncbi:MAG: AmmeMemoRadiSam system protein B [Deferribacterales bacterium]